MLAFGLGERRRKGRGGELTRWQQRWCQHQMDNHSPPKQHSTHSGDAGGTGAGGVDCTGGVGSVDGGDGQQADESPVVDCQLAPSGRVPREGVVEEG